MWVGLSTVEAGEPSPKSHDQDVAFVDVSVKTMSNVFGVWTKVKAAVGAGDEATVTETVFELEPPGPLAVSLTE